MTAGRQNTLITGPLGHIGSHLIRHLDPAAFPGEVILLDNLESRRFASLFGLPRGARFRFVRDDIRTADFDALLRDVQAVVHLAAITDAEGSRKVPELVEAVNFEGLKRVADACLVHGVKLLFPSTTSVYGSQDARVDEACDELRPQSPYAAAKLHSEHYLRDLHARGLRCVTCRFGTIYGHSIGIRYDTAVNRFIWQAATGQPITVWKTAWNQKRPYLYLGDCIKAINFIFEHDLFDGDTFNVLTENLTVADVVNTLTEFIPDLATTFVNSPIMNQLSYEVDDTRFRRLGFRPEGRLRDGVRETVATLEALLPRAVSGLPPP
jgi:nucleoside-diphosphate-sugar epimerase